MRPLHLLHVFSTFKAAGPQIRFASIANALGTEFRHTIVAMDGNYDAAQRLDSTLTITLQPPPFDKGSLLCSLTMREVVRHVHPDLTLTYNWGAMDAVAGSRLAAVCPTIHTEDGFNPDEAVALKSRRVLARRLLLNGPRRHCSRSPEHDTGYGRKRSGIFPTASCCHISV
jgi:L-malate glycosyltransferase